MEVVVLDNSVGWVENANLNQNLVVSEVIVVEIEHLYDELDYMDRHSIDETWQKDQKKKETVKTRFTYLI